MNQNSPQGWKPLITIVLSMVMMYFTSFGINVLIAAIVKDLGTTVSNLQFVIVAASLIAGSLMVTAGRLADKFGKKKIFVLGSIIYTIGISLVVLAPNTLVFTIAWAVIWPAGMVLVVPTSISLIMHFYQGDQRATAFGVYGASLAAISAIAPVVVGFLANEMGWRVALSLSPIVGIVTILLGFTLQETDKNDQVQIDLPSVALSVLSFGLFLITTTMAGTYGWFFQKRPLLIGGEEVYLFGLSIVPILYLVSIVSLLMFFQRGKQLKARGQSPLLNVGILRNGTFTLGMTIGAILFMVTAGSLFTLSVFFQAGAKFDSLQTALALLPYSAAYAAISFSTPGLAKKIAPKWLVVAGCAVTIVALWLIGQKASTDMKTMDLIWLMIPLGVGMGAIMAQITTVTMSTVKPEESGEASGFSETMKEIIGQGFAVALAGSLLFGGVYSSMVDSFAKLEGVDLDDDVKQELVIQLEDIFQEISEEKEASFVESLPPNTEAAYQQLVKDAAESGLRGTLGAMNLCMIAGLVLALLLPGKTEKRE